jgi:hypothetical protein
MPDGLRTLLYTQNWKGIKERRDRRQFLGRLSLVEFANQTLANSYVPRDLI